MNSSLLVHHFEFHRWANNEILKIVEALPKLVREEERNSSFGGIFGTLAHQYQADAAWLDRFHQVPVLSRDKYAVPEDFTEFAAKWRAVLDGLLAFASEQDGDAWSNVLHYRLFSGKEADSPMWQMALHVVNHGSYHRGQVVTMLRQAGYQAISTDLIFFYRDHMAAGA